jgi:cyclopropane fatty-acyl-phospholipid synthase-like methyltransferase
MSSNFLAPYVPTPILVLEELLKRAQIVDGETLYDIGAGDGRIVIYAAREYGARCVGIEINEKLYRTAIRNVDEAGIGGRVDIINRDVFEVDLSPADIVVMYLTTRANERLKPKLERELKRSARVVTHDFAVPSWEHTAVFKVWVDIRYHDVYLYELGMQKSV